MPSNQSTQRKNKNEPRFKANQLIALSDAPRILAISQQREISIIVNHSENQHNLPRIARQGNNSSLEQHQKDKLDRIKRKTRRTSGRDAIMLLGDNS